MRMTRFALFAILLLTAAFAHAASSASDVLARMDKAASSFKGVKADISRVNYTAILNDRAEEQGDIAILRNGKNLQAKIHIQKPSERAVAFQGDSVEVFYPKLNTVQVFDLGKNRGLIDQFLLLGFGTSGKDLAKSYTVTADGSETVNGVNTTRLKLIPKSGKVREMLKRVEIWIPEGEAYPVRQKFIEPSDDYKEVTYKNLQINPGLSATDLKLNLPAGVKREYPQK